MYMLYFYCVCVNLFEIFVLSTTVNNNETKNSLAGRRISNFLNNSLQEILLLTPAIIVMIFFWMQNTFLLCV
jgi:hypothetical protein